MATEAASVAVKIPLKIPPKMMTGIIRGITLSLKETTISLKVALFPSAPGRIPLEDW